jgi:hypothetical protein
MVSRRISGTVRLESVDDRFHKTKLGRYVRRVATEEVEMTVRLSEEAFNHMRQMARTYGLSNRAMFETATKGCLDIPDRIARGELGPLHRRIHEAAWEVARRIDEETRTGEAQARRRVGFRLEAPLVDRLRDACSEFGVSMNSRLAVVVAPWGPDWGGSRHVATRTKMWEEIVAEARRVTGLRRYG